jgi:hypothetical protein
MDKETSIKLFEDRKVRTLWDKEQEKWYISIVDVIEVLTESTRPRKYWDDLKRKLYTEGSELSEKIGQLKMQAPEKKPKTMTENKKVAKQGGSVAGAARKKLELETGKKVVSKLNAKHLKALTDKH